MTSPLNPFPTPLPPPPPPPSSYYVYSPYHQLFDDFTPLYTPNPSIDDFMPPQHPSFAAAAIINNFLSLPHADNDIINNNNNNFLSLPHAGINNNNNIVLSHEDHGSINISDYLSHGDDAGATNTYYNFLSPGAEAEDEGGGIINSNDVASISMDDNYISVDAYGNAAVAGDWRQNLPPGVRFRPTDRELIIYYLKPNFGNESFDNNQPVVFKQVYNYLPHQLFETGRDDDGDGKRYFYTRLKKLGVSKTDRSISGEDNGNWKATQKGEAIADENGNQIGWKTPLAYFDKNKKKTQWLMQEYKLLHHNAHHLVLVVVYYYPPHNRI